MSNSGDSTSLLKPLLQRHLRWELSDDALVLLHGRMALVLDEQFKKQVGEVVAVQSDGLQHAPWTSTVCTGKCGSVSITESEFEWLMCQNKEAEKFYHNRLDLESLLC